MVSRDKTVRVTRSKARMQPKENAGEEQERLLGMRPERLGG